MLLLKTTKGYNSTAWILTNGEKNGILYIMKMKTLMKKLGVIFAVFLCFLYSACANGGLDSGITDTVEITFKQLGQPDVIREVSYGETLQNVPTPVGKTGYNVGWDVADFTNIIADITVNAVAVPKRYLISLMDGNKQIDRVEVTYDQPYTFQEPKNEDKDFAGWKYGENIVLSTTGVWKIDGENIVLVAKWGSNSHSGNY